MVSTLGGEGPRTGLVGDIAGRAGAIAAGRARGEREGDTRLDACARRARAIADAGGASEETRRSAAIEFLGDAVTALALDGVWAPGEARRAIEAAAAAIDTAPGAALLATFLRAVASSDAAQLPPQLGASLFLWLLVELGPAEAASLWAPGRERRTECLAAAGDAPRSRRLKTSALALLDGRSAESEQVRSVVVERWDRPYAALAARCNGCESARLNVWLREAAAALSPVLERETLFERNAARERELVSAAERRLLRFGYDLHDGPLQELVALAEDLRLARSQMTEIVAETYTGHVAGRFDDLAARLEALDRDLRELAHAARPTTAIERPLEHVLRNELEALARSSEIETSLSVEGDTATLTDSQKIVLYRLVQESLANIRKHSGATRAEVRVRVLPAYTEASVSDNGRGFDIHATVQRALDAKRLGLAGVSERVRLLGGAVDIEARVGEGVVVRATLPAWRPAAAPLEPIYAAATA